jgi:hypothetical protein
MTWIISLIPIYHLMSKPVSVLQLIEALQEIDDPNRIVVVSRDAEGNGFSVLGQLSLHKYIEEDVARGDIFPDKVTSGQPCVVIWPSH